MQTPRRAAAPLPITVLTGFLGAGKTTLVNRILHERHGKRIAVIVNEFGDLGIDTALVGNVSGSVVELANGCVCCATQGDLARALREIAVRELELDALLIETSGLADPGPVVAMLQAGRMAGAFRLDGVITVIDAENFDRNLDEAEVAFQQIAGADLMILNKADTVPPEIAAKIENGLARINGAARVIRAMRCDVDMDLVFGFDRKVVAEEVGRTPGAAPSPRSHKEFESTSLRLDGRLEPNRFDAWLDGLGSDVVRAKGFVHFAGNDRPVTVHLVGRRRSVEPAPAGVGADAAAIVLIGRNLSAAALMEGLKGCRA